MMDAHGYQNRSLWAFCGPGELKHYKQIKCMYYYIAVLYENVEGLHKFNNYQLYMCLCQCLILIAHAVVNTLSLHIF